jgi:hypothetical protein
MRLLDVAPDERRAVLPASAALAALLAGHTALETARDAMFLQSLPPSRLALGYAVMAVLAIAAVPINTWLVRRLERRGALVATLGVAALGTTGFAALPAGPATAMALHLWTGLVATLATVQLWLFAGELFGGARGRRLLAPLAVAGALGACAGAVLASAVVTWGALEHLLPLAAGCYALAARLAGATPEAPPARPDATPAQAWPRRTPRRGYLRGLALIVALSTAALLLNDFLFKITLTESLPGDELPIFLARYNAAVTALSLVVQVLGVGWLVRGRRRLLLALTVLPALLLMGAAASLALPFAFVGVALAKGADGVLRHSLHRVSLELLWTPLSPALRAQARPPIDGILVRVTQAVTAASLLVLAPTGPVAPSALAAGVAAIATLWLIVALAIRRPAIESLPSSSTCLPRSR